MASHLVFTVIAQDRPGLVERLAEAIASSGGNWVDSSMARLGGEFAGIVSVEIETDAIEKLHQHFDELLSDGIAITLRSDGKPKTVPTGPAARMDLVSQDHPGILHQVSHVLAEHDVSIENLETSVTAGSMSGERLFKASAELRLPADLQPGTLSDALQETAGDMMAEINLAD